MSWGMGPAPWGAGWGVPDLDGGCMRASCSNTCRAWERSGLCVVPIVLMQGAGGSAVLSWAMGCQ